MKKIIIIVIVIVVLGALVYLMGKITPVNSNVAVIKGAWLGQESALCTFVQPADEYWPEEQVSVYIKAGKIRMITQEETEAEGHIIIKDNMVYYWDSYTAVKMLAQEQELAGIPLFADLDNKEEFNKIAQEYQIKCEKIAIEDSFFDTPEDIEFQDYAEMMSFDLNLEENLDLEEPEVVE
ncbi:MAG: hypothetical protein PHN37_02335 [Candidatus Pacebacteria bacterium]|nr:hypothetical protein [Candidatus Paceibacterota bacterium]